MMISEVNRTERNIGRMVRQNHLAYTALQDDSNHTAGDPIGSSTLEGDSEIRGHIAPITGLRLGFSVIIVVLLSPSGR
jgi:hypothetical protein